MVANCHYCMLDISSLYHYIYTDIKMTGLNDCTSLLTELCQLPNWISLKNAIFRNVLLVDSFVGNDFTDYYGWNTKDGIWIFINTRPLEIYGTINFLNLHFHTLSHFLFHAPLVTLRPCYSRTMHEKFMRICAICSRHIWEYDTIYVNYDS